MISKINSSRYQSLRIISTDRDAESRIRQVVSVFYPQEFLLIPNKRYILSRIGSHWFRVYDPKFSQLSPAVLWQFLLAPEDGNLYGGGSFGPISKADSEYLTAHGMEQSANPAGGLSSGKAQLVRFILRRFQRRNFPWKWILLALLFLWLPTMIRK